MQALSLEVLQLLQCLLEYNPGLVDSSQGCGLDGFGGLSAGTALDPGVWQVRPVGCLLGWT